MSINQKSGQVDPTITSPVIFTAVFSEPINTSTFTTGSISTSGSTATGIVVNSITEVAPNNGTTFEISIGASDIGTIVASIPAAYFSSTILGTTGAGPHSVITDAMGNTYTTNYNSDTVTKITPDGTSSILGTTGSGPQGIVIDNSGNIYTANYNSSDISKIAPDGTSTILATTGLSPYGIIMDNSGNIYTTNWSSNDISKIAPDGTSSILGTAG